MLDSAISADTYLSFEIQGARGPPSVSQMSGFSFRTLSLEGEVIDESSAPDSISLSCTDQTASSPSNVDVESSVTSINAESVITLTIFNVNPLPINSDVQIVIPSDFDSSILNSIELSGTSVYTSPAYSFDLNTRTLYVSDFNSRALAERQFFRISFGKVVNPGKTEPTGSFGVSFFDDQGNAVETVSSGVTYTATAGGFSDVSLSASNTVINRENVAFTFTFRPEDSFTSDAVLKLIFPPELKLHTFANV